MNAPPPERVAVLAIRVWVEADSEPRARITATLDVVAEPPTTFVVSSVDELCDLVRSLVTSFLVS